MKKGFKKILVVSIIIICGFKYIVDWNDIEPQGTSGEGINISLNDKNNVVEGNDKLILVNSKLGLSGDYIPKGLGVPNIPFSDESEKEEKQVAGIVIKPIENLVNSAREEGIILLGNSGYRSYKSQKNVYKDRIKSQGKELADAYVAKPGFSEHQTGLCIDITNEDKYFVQGTIEADWLAENCYKFGFIIRFPEGKRSITGIEYEPWHIRYVGEEAAQYIYNNNITLEEYLGEGYIAGGVVNE